MKIAFGLILLIATAYVQAEVYHYRYLGHELQLRTEPDYEVFSDAPIADRTRPAFQFDVWIDTDFLPDGVLADFNYDCDIFDECPDGLLRVAGNNRFDSWNDNNAYSYASFSFDSNGNITDWVLGMGWDAPLHGPRTTTELDRIEEWHFDLYEWEAEQPGTWERVLPAPPERKGIVTSDIFFWDETMPLNVGDGTNSVAFFWVLAGEFWGSTATGVTTSSVAIATGIKHISEIEDASIFEFTDDVAGPICDAECDPDGVGDFVVARNNETGHYGVLQVKKIYDREWLNDVGGIEIFHELDGTWWFQTDGSSNFSAAQPETTEPEPKAGAIGWPYLFGLTVIFILSRNRIRLS